MRHTTNEEGAPLGAPSLQHFPQGHSSRSPVERARQVLHDAVLAAGVDDFSRMAIQGAAESYARERMRAEFAGFVAELNTDQEQAA